MKRSSHSLHLYLLTLISFALALTINIPVATAVETTKESGVDLIETGIVLEPDKIQTIGIEDSGDIDTQLSSSKAALQAITEQSAGTVPKVKVLWQNSKYTNNSRAVSETACTSSNYRVISKAWNGKIPVEYAYYYQCYTGSGNTAFSYRPTIGYVTHLCPGNNNYASIYFTNTLLQYDNNWYWSTSTHPPTASNWQCYVFSGTNEGLDRGVRYNRVNLNSPL